MKNRGFVLIASVFLVLFLGIFLSMALSRSYIQLKSIDLRKSSLYAFYTAEAGIDRTVFELRKDLAWPAVAEDTEGKRQGFTDEAFYWSEGNLDQELVGAYNVTVQDAPDLNGIPTVWVESSGRNSLGPAVCRRIRARVVKQAPADFFTSTVGDLTIASGAQVGESANPVKVLARDVKFEANMGLPVGDAARKITVNGDIEYLRNLTGDADPDVTITGSKIKRPPITFVGVDLARYKQLAEESGKFVACANKDIDGVCLDPPYTIVGDGSHNITRDILDTANGLVFVEGDISIEGNVQESVHIVSGKNIYIQGSITCVPAEGEIQPQIGLSAAKNVVIPAGGTNPNDINIDAMIIADGGVFEAQYVGAPKGILNFEGVIAVRGKDSPGTAVNLNVFATRHLQYDSDLRDSPTIPFLSYIVNIIEWAELDYSPALIDYSG